MTFKKPSGLGALAALRDKVPAGPAIGAWLSVTVDQQPYGWLAVTRFRQTIGAAADSDLRLPDAGVTLAVLDDGGVTLAVERFAVSRPGPDGVRVEEPSGGASLRVDGRAITRVGDRVALTATSKVAIRAPRSRVYEVRLVAEQPAFPAAPPAATRPEAMATTAATAPSAAAAAASTMPVIAATAAATPTKAPTSSPATASAAAAAAAATSTMPVIAATAAATPTTAATLSAATATSAAAPMSTMPVIAATAAATPTKATSSAATASAAAAPMSTMPVIAATAAATPTTAATSSAATASTAASTAGASASTAEATAPAHPASAARARARAADLVLRATARTVEGDLAIDGWLELADGARLVCSGDLRCRGVIIEDGAHLACRTLTTNYLHADGTGRGATLDATGVHARVVYTIERALADLLERGIVQAECCLHFGGDLNPSWDYARGDNPLLPELYEVHDDGDRVLPDVVAIRARSNAGEDVFVDRAPLVR